MRVFIPAVPAELSGDVPPPRTAIAPIIPADATPEQVELLEDDAVTEAWLVSLELLVGDGPASSQSADLRRVVLAADVDPAGTAPVDGSPRPVVEVDPVAPLSWDDVKAILADAPGDDTASEAIVALAAATDDAAVDDALSALADDSLQWFDISERAQLS